MLTRKYVFAYHLLFPCLATCSSSSESDCRRSGLPSSSSSYKYGWTPSSSFPHCHCLKSYCCRKNPFLRIHWILRHLSNNFFGYVFCMLLLAFRRVILPCFWPKMRLCCVHDNAKRALHCTVTGTTRPSIIITLLPEVWHQTVPPSSARSYRNSLPMCTTRTFH